ncbi:Hypothetical predicted protein, partial [Marmota monax]
AALLGMLSTQGGEDHCAACSDIAGREQSDCRADIGSGEDLLLLSPHPALKPFVPVVTG